MLSCLLPKMLLLILAIWILLDSEPAGMLRHRNYCSALVMSPKAILLGQRKLGPPGSHRLLTSTQTVLRYNATDSHNSIPIWVQIQYSTALKSLTLTFFSQCLVLHFSIHYGIYWTEDFCLHLHYSSFGFFHNSVSA